MPFNKETDSTIVISKKHKQMLILIRKANKVFMRKLIEEFIEDEYKKVKE